MKAYPHCIPPFILMATASLSRPQDLKRGLTLTALSLPSRQDLKRGLTLEERLTQFLDMAADMTASARREAAWGLTASLASVSR